MIFSPMRAYEEGWIKGLEDVDKQVQQNGIDVRVESIQEIISSGVLRKEGKELPRYKALTPEDVPDGREVFAINIGKAYIMTSYESVRIPENVVGMVFMRSTLNRIGAPIHSGLYDSGFKGRIQPTLYPMNHLLIEKGARFAQIIFMQAQSYKLYDGQYQERELEGTDKDCKLVDPENWPCQWAKRNVDVRSSPGHHCPKNCEHVVSK